MSKALLTELSAQFYRQAVSLQDLQNKLNDKFCDEKYQGAGSTLVMTQYHSDSQTFSLNHLGDSRIYHFDGQLQQWKLLTQDHTYINELRQEQLLADNVTYASCYDILYHYFCIEYNYQIKHFPPQHIQLKSGDFLLLCTDGVYDVLDCQNWLLPNQYTLKDWLVSMQKLLKNHKAWDNITMILVKYQQD